MLSTLRCDLRKSTSLRAAWEKQYISDGAREKTACQLDGSDCADRLQLTPVTVAKSFHISQLFVPIKTVLNTM